MAETLVPSSAARAGRPKIYVGGRSVGDGRDDDRQDGGRHETRRRGGRLGVLDGLRLLAALMVVAFHYTCIAPNKWGMHNFPRLYHVTAYGRLGVELFFLISGFVICMSAWGRSLGAFFTSRATRLYPAYWLAVLASALAQNLFSPGSFAERSLSFRDVVVNLTMLEAPLGVPLVDYVYWTLWLELHFYLLFAIVVWRGVTYRRVVVFSVVWLVVAIMIPGTSGPTPNWPQPVLDALIDSDHAPFFVAGLVLYLMYRFRPTILLWGMLGVCYALAIHQAVEIADQFAPATAGALKEGTAMAVMTAIFAVMTAVALGWLNWIRGAWLTFAGALTYPLYLFHEQIGWLVIGHAHDRVPSRPLVAGLVAAMLIVAWLVHRLVERPVGAWLKRTLTSAIAQVPALDKQPRQSG